MLWAGRSVWHDRHVGIVEVPGSNPGPSTNFRFQSSCFWLLVILGLVLAGLMRCLGWQGFDFQVGLCSKMSIFGCLFRVCNNGLLMRLRIVFLDGNLT